MSSVKGAEHQLRSGLGKVDLRGLEPGGPGWEAARAAVAASMEAVGTVVVTHDALGADLRQALFGRAMPEFFALPLDAKRSLVSGPVNGYIGPRPGAPAYESVRIWEAAHGAGAGARNLGDALWPHGNPAFCDTVATFARNMLDLKRKVGRMILESLGVPAECVESHLDSLAYNVRLAHYGPLPDTATTTTGLSMQPHRDCTMLTMVIQHGVEGLEVQVEDGSWIAVPPEPDTVTVVAGELLTVVANGRVPAGIHRVRTPGDRERMSVLFVSTPKEGATVRPLDELVDDNHPLMYGDCSFSEYVDFRFAGDGRKLSDPLKAFCGALKDKQ
ncbi:unnamed protein product [Urochloa decumbens]|uniref:2-oxoglutarate-dependent dioxygenase DAO n=1 Tax=Urochloa decumbens TaxID=240449 RepID=A0ABC9BTG2_9POAL